MSLLEQATGLESARRMLTLDDGSKEGGSLATLALTAFSFACPMTFRAFAHEWEYREYRLAPLIVGLGVDGLTTVAPYGVIQLGLMAEHQYAIYNGIDFMRHAPWEVGIGALIAARFAYNLVEHMAVNLLGGRHRD